jgi:hypothetical protein
MANKEAERGKAQKQAVRGLKGIAFAFVLLFGIRVVLIASRALHTSMQAAPNPRLQQQAAPSNAPQRYPLCLMDRKLSREYLQNGSLRSNPTNTKTP